MKLKKCSLCFIECSSKQRFSQSEERTIKSEEVFKQSNNSLAKEDDPINNQLKIIFLLRKILEISQDQCCDFLVDYGDPCSWINYCPSCSDLIEKGKTIFDQMTLLQKQFKDLQNEIKRTITLSVCKNESEEECKLGVQEIVRSFIYQGSSDLMIASENEETAEETFYSDLNDAGSKQLNCLSQSTILTDVWSEEEDFSDITREGGNGTFDDQDPLVLGGADNVDEDLTFCTPDIKIETEECCYLIKNKQIIANGQQDPLPKRNVVANDTGENSFCECDICGKGFRNKFNLRRHRRIHTGEKPYICAFCEKSFSQNIELKNHERIHTGEKPYACAFCGKSFARSSSLKYHERTHTGEKPYACRICGKSYAVSSNLKLHERTHTCEKPFGCRYCEKMFTNSSNLKDHIRSHTREKPYRCRFCEKCFTQRSSLKLHERTHTADKPYQCKFCEKQFTHSRKLNGHEKTHKRKRTL